MTMPGYDQPTPPAPPAPKKKAGCAKIGCFGVLAVVAIAGLGAILSGNKTTPSAAPAAGASTPSAPTAIHAKATPPPPKPKGPSTSFAGNGDYRVGTDIAAGTYQSLNNSSESACYWERDSSADGSFNAIIANGNPVGTAIVTIEPTDKFFSTQNCNTWNKIG
jgi:hypothetical protein